MDSKDDYQSIRKYFVGEIFYYFQEENLSKTEKNESISFFKKLKVKVEKHVGFIETIFFSLDNS